MTIHRCQVLTIWVVSAQLIFHVLLAVRLMGQASQDTINERQSIMMAAQDARLEHLESAELPARVRVLESDMAEVKWLARGVVVAVFGQLFIAGMGLRDARRNGR